MWDQVLHPYKTRGKIIVLHIRIFIFFDQKKKGIWKIHVFQTAVQSPVVTGLLQTVPHHHCPLSDPLNTTVTNYYYYNINLWMKVCHKNTWHKNWSRSSFNLTSLFCCILRASGSTFLFCSTNFAVICCFNKHICFHQSSTLLCFYHPHTTSRINRSLQKFPIRTRKEVERTGLMLGHQSFIQGQI